MTNTGAVEIEITGPIATADLHRIRGLAGRWKLVGSLDRYLINFTTEELRERKLDVRARITNGVTEFVVKRGEWGGHKRIETVVRCAESQFESLVSALLALGYVKGVGCHRKIERYTDAGIEFSLIEVPGYSFFYEAELLEPTHDSDADSLRLREWAAQQGLQVFAKHEFLAFIDDLDANANDLLDLSQEDSWQILRKRIGST